MLKLLYCLIITTAAALLACASPTPTPDPRATLAPTPAATTATLTPAATTATLTPAPQLTATATPSPRPTLAPTPTAAPKPTTAAGMVAPAGIIAPIDADNPQAFLSTLPAAEQTCLTENSDPMRAITLAGLPGAAIASPQDVAKLIGCLGDDTLMQIFLSGMLVDVGPLSADSSACIRAGFANLNLRPVLMAGDFAAGPGYDLLEQAALFGSLRPHLLALSCLSETEWVAGLTYFAMPENHRETLQCVRETVGGPAALAAALQPLDGPIPRTFMHAETQCLMLPIPQPAADGGEISLIDTDNPQAFLSTLSAAEQACLAAHPNPMDALTSLPLVSSGGEADTPEPAAELLACLGDDALLRVFLSVLISDLDSLSRESSECVRAGFAGYNLRSLLLADGFDNMSAADVSVLSWAGFLLPLCLNDAERQAAFPYGHSISDTGRAGWRCLMDQLGGPARLRLTRELSPSYYAALVECPE